MATSSEENVVQFPGTTRVVPPSLDRDALPETMTPEQEAMYGALAILGNFLLENRDNIEYFVAMVAEKNPAPEDSSMVAHHVFTSPIKVADFALCLKMLENSFFNNVNNRASFQ